MAQERAGQRPLSLYRVYTNTRDTLQNLKNVGLPGPNHSEIHVVLAFARDYDNLGNPPNGVFHPYFNVNPDYINNVKRANRSVKFFLSIGGRNPNFPFRQVDPHNWVINAIQSLGNILMNYHFDGIDIYYEHINNTANDQNNFVGAMTGVIGGLANGNFVSNQQLLSSITLSAPLIETYVLLAHDSNYVVYQTHSEVSPVHTPEELVQLINHIPPAYPREKLLAGHSFLKADWATVPPPVFFDAIPQLLNICRGISMISDDDRAAN